MERTDGQRPDAVRGGPLVGPGLRAFDPDTSPATKTDPDIEPAGYLVAMDDAVRIHFLDWGEPRPSQEAFGLASADLGVLLIHGLAQTAWTWAPVARRLGANARVVAMDLRGHGLSDAPAYGYAADQLAEDAIAVAEGAGLLRPGGVPIQAGSPDGRAFVVAGHGYGAAVAAWTARALGRRCAGLVLVDGGWTDLPAETGLSPEEWLAAIEEPPHVFASMAAWLADREAFDPASWSPDQDRAARAEVVETPAGRVKPAIHRHALAASIGALWTYEPAVVLPGVEARIVTLAARDDGSGRQLDALGEVALRRAAAGRTPIRAVAFPGLGHNLMRYRPDAVVAAIREAGRMEPGAVAGASG